MSARSSAARSPREPRLLRTGTSGKQLGLKVLIRADSSVEIGAGHVSRCAALALELNARGVRPTLLTRDLPGSASTPAAAFDVILLSADADGDERAAMAARNWFSADSEPSWLIVDHYDLDATWERAAAGPETSVLAIDDLANRRHECQLLLDQNLPGATSSRYEALVPGGCRMLFGPGYALLRPEFAEARSAARLRVRNGTVERVLVFFGGTDPGDLTSMTLAAIGELRPAGVAIDVAVGSGNPRGDAIRALVAEIPGATFHFQTDRMAALMAKADLSVGAGGTATWERCCVGLPALVAIVAENQARVVIDASALGACVSLGHASELTASCIASSLDDALSGRIDLASIASAAFGLTDGAGAVRVADAMLAPVAA